MRGSTVVSRLALVAAPIVFVAACGAVVGGALSAALSVLDRTGTMAGLVLGGLVLAFLAAGMWWDAVRTVWPVRRAGLLVTALFGVGSTAGAFWGASRDWYDVPPGWGVADWIAYRHEWWLFAVPAPALVAMLLVVRHCAGLSAVERRALRARATVLSVRFVGEDTDHPRAVCDLRFSDRFGAPHRARLTRAAEGGVPSDGHTVTVSYDPCHPSTVLDLSPNRS